MYLKKYSNFFVIVCCMVSGFFIHAGQKKFIVVTPVADFRGELNAVPQEVVKGPALSQDIGSQETQLLQGEYLFGEEIPGQPEWIKAQALEQEIFSHDGKRIPYPGFIKKNCVREVTHFPAYNLVTKKLRVPLYQKPDQNENIVSHVFLGTKLAGKKQVDEWQQVTLADERSGYVLNTDVYELVEEVSEKVGLLRAMIVEVGTLCIDCPYVWGGRSYSGSSDEGFVTGLDCSGLINLIFRVVGLQVPRNAHDQFLASEPIKQGSLLQPGDVMFLARKKPQGTRVYHVMLYVGDGMLLEATGNPDGLGVSRVADAACPKDLTTRLISVQDYFGKPIEKLHNQDLCESGHRKGSTVLFGTLFASQEKIKQLRLDELGRKYHNEIL